MDGADFEYDLPETLIAQVPSAQRENSQLLVYHKTTGEIEHRRFFDIEHFLQAGDCIIVNDSKVIKARLWGQKLSTPSTQLVGKQSSALSPRAKVEFLWLADEETNRWRGLLRGKHKIGERILFGDRPLVAIVTSKNTDGSTILDLDQDVDTYAFLEQFGQVPLPPYICRTNHNLNEQDEDRYQTVYGASPGSVAAPTAGLHFSQELMNRLMAKGIKFIPITLHVGLGTFQPLREEALSKDKLHAESFEVSEQSASDINRALVENRRLIVIGTTSARALESAADEKGFIVPGRGKTELFIRPGYVFRFVKNLVTNFHLPRSSLLALVSAFIGREKVMEIYQLAIRENYRFYSYGDAMLIQNTEASGQNSE